MPQKCRARQATSTTLSVFTICIALSCTIGGLIYDTLGWKGMATFHTAGEALLLLLLCFEPACRVSFKEAFFPTKEDNDTTDAEKGPDVLEGGLFVHVDPANCSNFTSPRIQKMGMLALPGEVSILTAIPCTIPKTPSPGAACEPAARAATAVGAVG